MKRFILLSAMIVATLSLSAQRRMQVWEGNTYMQFFTTDVDSVTFLQFPDGILQECEDIHDTIIKTVTVHDTITQTIRDTITKTIKDTVYIDVCGSGVATVITNAVTHATYNSLALGGTVRFSDYDAITERGICYATHTEPTTADHAVKVGKGTGTFSITITGLTAQTTYYLRAYAVNEAGTAYGNEVVYTTPEKGNAGGSSTGTEGSLVGKFSVSADKQVSFSKGNLQYQASTNTWRFAENQTDYIGNSNSNISATYDGWIDLFGWGTSGFDNTSNDPAAQRYQPWSSATNQVALDSVWNCEMQPITGECQWEYTYSDYNAYGYGPSTNMTDGNLVGTSANYDWGVYNAISNGGSQAGLWRTLTSSEWNYLFNTRKNAEYLWSRGTVNGVYGMILLADDFVKPASVTWTPAASGWTTNVYDAEHWKAMETAGAVFLPAAGYRGGRDVLYVRSSGYYWSSTAYRSHSAYHLYFFDYDLYPQYNNGRSRGYSVRLVQDL